MLSAIGSDSQKLVDTRTLVTHLDFLKIQIQIILQVDNSFFTWEVIQLFLIWKFLSQSSLLDSNVFLNLFLQNIILPHLFSNILIIRHTTR